MHACDIHVYIYTHLPLSRATVADHLAAVRKLITGYGGNGSVLTSVYSFENFYGYAAKLSDRYRGRLLIGCAMGAEMFVSPPRRARDVLRSMKEVAYVECNQKVHTLQSCSLQTGATWVSFATCACCMKGDCGGVWGGGGGGNCPPPPPPPAGLKKGRQNGAPAAKQIPRIVFNFKR